MESSRLPWIYFRHFSPPLHEDICIFPVHFRFAIFNRKVIPFILPITSGFGSRHFRLTSGLSFSTGKWFGPISGIFAYILPVWGLSISGQLPVCHFQRGNDVDLFRVYLHITSGLGSFTSGLPFYAGIATVCFWDVSILLPVWVANLLPVGGENEFDWIKFDWSSEPDALNIQMTTGNEALLISVIARWFVCDFFGGGRGLLSPGGREVFVSVCCGRGGEGEGWYFYCSDGDNERNGIGRCLLLNGWFIC